MKILKVDTFRRPGKELMTRPPVVGGVRDVCSASDLKASLTVLHSSVPSSAAALLRSGFATGLSIVHSFKATTVRDFYPTGSPQQRQPSALYPGHFIVDKKACFEPASSLCVWDTFVVLGQASPLLASVLTCVDHSVRYSSFMVDTSGHICMLYDSIWATIPSPASFSMVLTDSCHKETRRIYETGSVLGPWCPIFLRSTSMQTPKSPILNRFPAGLMFVVAVLSVRVFAATRALSFRVSVELIPPRHVSRTRAKTVPLR
ncbi:hypothetical protein GGTG_14093 [Gaeumannomyces tritici R3-111a-1]|uniref:Uncharacterized protein n=1 Tax=Gaeumannomyces tritici (strain R3-111a-1) TaxID=644352 RepID=J3PKN0_GAET3|nr:hypothetical protein GGTG_14093 [Gaeumannomyces tritici R3-111a-1]EJT68327.1 hypothetical protein GGTG_14093 [Gaeumannomyces tritici R3-111a-1]